MIRSTAWVQSVTTSGRENRAHATLCVRATGPPAIGETRHERAPLRPRPCKRSRCAPAGRAAFRTCAGDGPSQIVRRGDHLNRDRGGRRNDGGAEPSDQRKRRGPGACPDIQSFGFARSRRSPDRGSDSRSPGREAKPPVHQREGACRGRSLLSAAQSGAALARQGHGEWTRQGGDRPHQERRRRRPRSSRLQAAGLCLCCARGAGRGRADAHVERADLCAACAGRAGSPSHGAGGQYRAAATRARSGRGAGGDGRSGRRRQGARSVQPAARALSQAQGGAGAIARHDRRRARRNHGGPGAQVQQQAPDGRRPRAAVARAARRRRRGNRPALRRTACRSREGISARQRSAGDRQSRRSDGQEAQSDERRPHRNRDRQHGALALVSARDPPVACGGQRARLHAQGDPRRQAGMGHAHRHRQAEHADPHPRATDGFHHRQPDLESAGVDRAGTNTCRRRPGTRARWRAWEFAPSASTARS